MIGQPMDASGFGTLASHFPDRTVVTYDPRGLGRSTRRDGTDDHATGIQAADVHGRHRGARRGSCRDVCEQRRCSDRPRPGGSFPDDVTILVAHEPPLIPVLPDAQAAERARAGVRDVYEGKGSGAGMAAFIMMTSWRGDFTDDYFAQPAPDPPVSGMPNRG
jgi:hypothetical protein